MNPLPFHIVDHNDTASSSARARHSRRDTIAVPVHPAPLELPHEAPAREPRRLFLGPHAVIVVVQAVTSVARRRLEAFQLVRPCLAADALYWLRVVALRRRLARGFAPALPEDVLSDVAHFVLVGKHGPQRQKWGAARARKM